MFTVVEENIKQKYIIIKIQDWRRCCKEEDEVSAALKEYCKKGIKKFIFDFERVSLVNSSFFGMLVNWYKLFNKNGCEMIIYHLDEMMKKSFQVTQIDSFVKVLPEKEDALSYIKDS